MYTLRMGLIFIAFLSCSNYALEDIKHEYASVEPIIMNENRIIDGKKRIDDMVRKRKIIRSTYKGALTFVSLAGLCHTYWSFYTMYISLFCKPGEKKGPISEVTSRGFSWFSVRLIAENIGKNMFDVLVKKVSARMYDHIMEPETISWFTTQYACYTKTIREIVLFARQAYQAPSEKKKYYIYALCMACNRLVYQLESIISFMHYECNCVSVSHKASMRVVVDTVTYMSKNFSVTIAQQLQQCVRQEVTTIADEKVHNDYEALIKEVQQLERDMKSYISFFENKNEKNAEAASQISDHIKEFEEKTDQDLALLFK